MATQANQMIDFAVQLGQPKNRFVAGIALLAGLGGFLFGFDTGVVGSAEPYFAPALHISMTTALGRNGTFWLFGFFALCALGFSLTRVPETRGRSLEEIEQELGGDQQEEATQQAA